MERGTFGGFGVNSATGTESLLTDSVMSVEIVDVNAQMMQEGIMEDSCGVCFSENHSTENHRYWEDEEDND